MLFTITLDPLLGGQWFCHVHIFRWENRSPFLHGFFPRGSMAMARRILLDEPLFFVAPKVLMTRGHPTPVSHQCPRLPRVVSQHWRNRTSPFSWVFSHYLNLEGAVLTNDVLKKKRVYIVYHAHHSLPKIWGEIEVKMGCPSGTQPVSNPNRFLVLPCWYRNSIRMY